MIVDTHLHVIDRTRLHYQWLEGNIRLNRDHAYVTYETEARRAGIEASMHMEVDVDPEDIEAETVYVGEIAKRKSSLVKGAIASCRPEETDFPAYLERQRDNPLVKGLRRCLHVMPDELSAQKIFRDNIKRLSGAGLTFDLVVLPRQMDKAIALCDSAPGVQFVIDHCGVPDIKGGEMEPWRANIAEIAKRPNIAAKISGVIAYADPDTWTVEHLRPWVEHVISAFGWNRVVWGSDWPVCTLGGSLSTWVAATHALIAGASADERNALLAGNARRLWRLE